MPKTCFVVMPFGNKSRDPEKCDIWTELYFDHIKPLVESLPYGLHCIRGDEVARPGSIIRDIVDKLATAEVAIVEMTDRNPNVFYELGVRHALSNRTILLSQQHEDIPFDLGDCRTILYRFTPRGVEKLKAQLEKAVAEVIDHPDSADNPVQSYLSEARRVRESLRASEPQKSATRQGQELLTEIEGIKRQNHVLAAAVAELREAVLATSPANAPNAASDLVGTWIDVAFGHDKNYAGVLDEHLIVTYEGSWPGAMFGTVRDGVFRFSWTRFDATLSGKGYLRVEQTGRTMTGGIWFDDTDIDAMLARNTIHEEHVLVRQSIEVDDSGKRLLAKAQDFLRSRGLV